MSIDPGAYEIRNVMHSNFAEQHGKTVVASAHPDVRSMGESESVLGVVWSISRFNNDRYTIRNMDTNHYAASPSFPAIEGNIITTQALQQWHIKETGVKGRYVIYTTAADIDLFWGLANGHLETPISLRDIPNTPSNQWALDKVDLWSVVGLLRAKLADLQNDETKLWDDHQKLQGEHTTLRGEYTELQDEHKNLRDRVELLNADAGKERARHAQAEAELGASYERASRQERARSLQTEAALKAHYEELLAERTNQRRCICM